MIIEKEAYDLYVQTYGKVKSGTTIINTDYTFKASGGGNSSYDTQKQLAVTIGVNDPKDGKPLRTKKDLESEIERMLK